MGQERRISAVCNISASLLKADIERTFDYRGFAPNGLCLVAAYPYLEVASGSIPLFLIASDARGEARNSISRLEDSISPEPATTAAENVWTNWISAARMPARSTPGACAAPCMTGNLDSVTGATGKRARLLQAAHLGRQPEGLAR